MPKRLWILTLIAVLVATPVAFSQDRNRRGFGRNSGRSASRNVGRGAARSPARGVPQRRSTPTYRVQQRTTTQRYTGRRAPTRRVQQRPTTQRRAATPTYRIQQRPTTQRYTGRRAPTPTRRVQQRPTTQTRNTARTNRTTRPNNGLRVQRTTPTQRNVGARRGAVGSRRTGTTMRNPTSTRRDTSARRATGNRTGFRNPSAATTRRARNTTSVRRGGAVQGSRSSSVARSRHGFVRDGRSSHHRRHRSGHHHAHHGHHGHHGHHRYYDHHGFHLSFSFGYGAYLGFRYYYPYYHYYSGHHYAFFYPHRVSYAYVPYGFYCDAPTTYVTRYVYVREDYPVKEYEVSEDEPVAVPDEGKKVEPEPVAGSPVTEKYLREASDLFGEAKYYEAARSFRLAALSAPDNAGPLFALAQALLAMEGNDDYAARVLRKAIRLNPKLVKEPGDIVGVYKDQAEFDRIVTALGKRAADSAPDSDSRFLLGAQQYFSGDPGARATFAGLAKALAGDEIVKLFVEAVETRFKAADDLPPVKDK